MKSFAPLALLFAFFASCEAFAPARTFRNAPTAPCFFKEEPLALQRSRKSVASVQTMGLFGLGPPEIAVILVAAAFLLGPQKLAELGKDAGKIAGELKDVPKEFQKGLEEGEALAKVNKASIADTDVKKEVAIADADVKKEESKD
jgi:sec-independent protein translocase protein TatA